MKKTIILAIVLSILTIFTSCKTITKSSSSIPLSKLSTTKYDKNNKVSIVYQGQVIQTLTVSQFTVLITSAGIYSEELSAEKKNRVYIRLTKSPWEITLGETFISDAIITWVDSKGKVIKTMTIEISLDRQKKDSFWLKVEAYYTTFAKIWTPVSFALLIILAIL